ncbi:MAG: nucleotidyl transferase AbiEii/AbiGii toxin family protein [Betaproteobacteria bacterium]|nr:nucleotidyl transferase AbiEii/AbiGii toxin family protein [Betaproteobacteria bacterium]MBI3054205.1 nucleotidyl transferase AbiEii/AbiGii toxin family protein [Betaproteobacteria bacterium]
MIEGDFGRVKATVSLGMQNSRMKDFYDLWALARQFEFDGDTLANAIRNTFDRRKTALATAPPVALLEKFTADEAKQKQWSSFLAKAGLEAPGLPEVRSVIEAFLSAPFQDGIWGHLRRSGISPSGPRSTCPRSSTKRPSAAWRSARRGSGRGRTAGLAQVSACALRESGLRPIRPPRRLFRIRHGPHLHRRRSRSSQDTEFTVDKIAFGTGLTNSRYCGFSDR